MVPSTDIDSDFQQSVDNSWTGNARTIGLTREPKHGVRMLHANSADAGSAFRLIGFYPNMRGGNGFLDVNLDGRGAAEKTGRRARGIELDPLYVDVAIRRWQAK